MAAINEATSMQTKDNIHNLSKELTHTIWKINMFEDHLLESRREEVKLRHDCDALCGGKSILEISSQDS